MQRARLDEGEAGLTSSRLDHSDSRGALDVFSQVGAALRMEREKAGISLARLAERSASGRSQLSKYENSKELPKLESLARVLDVLAVDPLTLFYWATRLARGLSEADIREEMLRCAVRRDAGSKPFKALFDCALDAHRAYLETKQQPNKPGRKGSGR